MNIKSSFQATIIIFCMLTLCMNTSTAEPYRTINGIGLGMTYKKIDKALKSNGYKIYSTVKDVRNPFYDGNNKPIQKLRYTKDREQVDVTFRTYPDNVAIAISFAKEYYNPKKDCCEIMPSEILIENYSKQFGAPKLISSDPSYYSIDYYSWNQDGCYRETYSASIMHGPGSSIFKPITRSTGPYTSKTYRKDCGEMLDMAILTTQIYEKNQFEKKYTTGLLKNVPLKLPFAVSAVITLYAPNMRYPQAEEYRIKRNDWSNASKKKKAEDNKAAKEDFLNRFRQ